MGDSPNVDQSQDDLLDNDSELTEDGKIALKNYDQFTSDGSSNRSTASWFCKSFGEMYFLPNFWHILDD